MNKQKIVIVFCFVFIFIINQRVLLFAGSGMSRPALPVTHVDKSVAPSIFFSYELRDFLNGMNVDGTIIHYEIITHLELCDSGSDAVEVIRDMCDVLLDDDERLNKVLEKCPLLKSLSLRGCRTLTGDFLCDIGIKCPQLSDVMLFSCTGFKSENFQYLPNNLKSLKVFESKLFLWSVLFNSRQCDQLLEFCFCGNEPIPQGQDDITVAPDFSMLSKSLEKISLVAVEQLSDYALAFIGLRCPYLNILNISFCHWFTGDGLKWLPDGLKRLVIGGCRGLKSEYLDDIKDKNPDLIITDHVNV